MSGLSDVNFPGGVNRPTFDRSVHDPTSVREVERRKSCLQLARDSSGSARSNATSLYRCKPEWYRCIRSMVFGLQPDAVIRTIGDSTWRCNVGAAALGIVLGLVESSSSIDCAESELFQFKPITCWWTIRRAATRASRNQIEVKGLCG